MEVFGTRVAGLFPQGNNKELKEAHMYKVWFSAAAAAALAFMAVAPGQANASWLSQLLHRAVDHAVDEPAYDQGYYGYYTTPGYYTTQPVPVPAYQQAPYANYGPTTVVPYTAPPVYYGTQYVQPYSYAVVPQYYGRYYAAGPAWRDWHRGRDHGDHGGRGREDHRDHGDHHDHH